ncbi:Protein CBG03047 [Caenorhabditis briggsae]|uniref:Protein CBG03047 n=1 Tax=Caenorhabditis briggsae TaxID=6238 RepID=A8WSX2_CAEBR|nr:Protein CBG03047 [Caenorhabditis briggsae]CAP23581.2 Protein CBG03047 [Caenorhabditis briggsae]
MISAVVLFLSAITVSNACVPTGTTTTTTPCCTMLSSNVLPRRPPSLTTQQQCSVLQRVSSTCPIDGIVVCDAAQETNPTAILVQFFNDAGVVVLLEQQLVVRLPVSASGSFVSTGCGEQLLLLEGPLLFQSLQFLARRVDRQEPTEDM